MYVSINSIKTYPLGLPKIGVANRIEAVLLGVEHGFKPDFHRIDHWIPATP